MLKLKELLTHTGKWSATIVLGSLLLGCGSGGGTDDILCGGDCNPEDEPQTSEGGVLGPSETPPAGIPAADKFSLAVSDFAPADAFDTNGIPVTFSVIVSDQFGNPVEDGIEVNFVSPESGQIQSQCVIADGTCSVNWVSSGIRPADGRVSILAYILRGSEEFGDKNGNFVFDVADENDFVDLGEVCLDEDENGTCEPQLNEFFVDLNDNGLLDGGDSVWNGPCFSDYINAAICNTPTSTAIGASATITMSTNTVIVQDLGTFPPEGSVINLNSGSAVIFSGIILTDSNGNALPTGTTVTFGGDTGNFTYVGSTSVAVEDQGATGPFGIGVQSNCAPTAGTSAMTLTITPPGGTPTVLNWLIDDSTVTCL